MKSVWMVALGALALAGAAHAQYEAKLVLEPALVLENGKPKGLLKDVFRFPDQPVERMMVGFLDDVARTARGADWTFRVRRKTQKKLEITYKRRFHAGSADANHAAAAARGFHGLTGWESEMEWGDQETLSWSIEEKGPKNENETAPSLPALADLRSLAKEKLPAHVGEPALPRAKAQEILGSAHLYGPVLAERWEAPWTAPESTQLTLVLEVWHLKAASGTGTEPFVEISFKMPGGRPDPQKAELFRLLKDAVAARGALKTDEVFKRYGGGP